MRVVVCESNKGYKVMEAVVVSSADKLSANGECGVMAVS